MFSISRSALTEHTFFTDPLPFQKRSINICLTISALSKAYNPTPIYSLYSRENAAIMVDSLPFLVTRNCLLSGKITLLLRWISTLPILTLPCQQAGKNLQLTMTGWDNGRQDCHQLQRTKTML